MLYLYDEVPTELTGGLPTVYRYKAGELPTHDRWPVQGTPKQEDAVAAVYAALHGSVKPEAVRKPSLLRSPRQGF